MKYRRKKSNKKIIITSLILIIMWIIGIYLYIQYNKIEILDKTSQKYEIQKLQSTISEQTVESVQENSQTIADIIEKVTKSVVGISKLKSTGNSILSLSNEAELGLGTGIIISENGYILSNEHVTGSKYSKCYITLENGQTHQGTVVWSEESLDLSITKIEAKNLLYATIGDSNKVRVGETVYAIRKSNRI